MSIDPQRPMSPLCRGWLEKIKKALEWKRTKFSLDAKELMKFFDGRSKDFWNSRDMKKYVDSDNDVNMPSFRMVVNKAFEFKSLYGPALYYQNPNRLVTPAEFPNVPPQLFGDPNNPMAQPMFQQMGMMHQHELISRNTVSSLVQTVLNYLPNEQNAKEHMRRGIDEGLIKGMSTWWTEFYQPPGFSGKLVGTFWDSCDNIVWDADATSWMEGVQWVARRCVHPTWEVEQKYGLKPDTLKGKGNLESLQSQGETTDNWQADYLRKAGKTNDLLVYWQVYSKMGMGDRMTGMSPDIKGMFDEFGDYCYLAVAENVEFPLNIPNEMITEAAQSQDQQQLDSVFSAAQWPIPFWIDGGWPCEVMGFHWSPDNPYPISPLRPGLGELKFLNWAMSFLAGKVKTTCRDFIVFLKSAESNLKKQVLEGKDMTTLEIDGDMHTDIKNVVSFLQHQPINRDIYTIIEAVANEFDKRVGLSDMMYGDVSSQSRSATDANVRSNNSRIRPDDMATIVDGAMTNIARKEAFACYWGLDGAALKPILGTLGSQAWDMLVKQLDPETMAREYDCRIEAGSTRRPNKDTRVQQMTQAMQVLGQFLAPFAQQGQVGPMNSLIGDWCKALDIQPDAYLIQPPPPPPQMMMPPPGPQGPPSPHGNGPAQGPPQPQQAPVEHGNAPVPTG